MNKNKMLKSLLFVPAKANMLRKVGQLDADAYIIDLEDSIENERKNEALKLVEKFIDNYNFAGEIFVRLNKHRYLQEVIRLDKFSNIGYMLPKFEMLDSYESGAEYFRKHKVIALIESPMGIVNVANIVTCDWVDALAFGAEDYVAFSNMENRNDLLRYQKSCLLTYAKAYQKPVYDTPSFHLGVCDAFKMDVQETIDFGFDGKLAISPKHIAYINQTFSSMSKDEILDIIERFEESGNAVQVIDGKVYERPHIEKFKAILRSNGVSLK